VTLTFDDLLARDLIERDITLTCVSNEVGGDLAGNARWLGAPLKTLLDEVQPEDGADQIVTTSSDGWTCGTPTALCRDGRDAMLAVAMNGQPLPVSHGFPVRMLVPGLYGYVSATKWIVDLELSSFADFDSYWVKRGWTAQAPVKTASRIDTPGSSAKLKSGPVMVAGVAWALHRGIDKVEVRVDEGAWQTADLATEANLDTWRQWRWPWPNDEAGSHTIECRATDGTGATQTDRRQPPFPDGATGWHSVAVTTE
jgi:DMSO/TMAO reductase YedYZ molybdopterin-dependent catalytic subunit